MVTDVLVIVVSVFSSQFFWLGIDSHELYVAGNQSDIAELLANYWIVSAVLVVVWTALLKFYATRDDRVLGAEVTEYKRILDATLLLFAVITCVAYLGKIDFARGYIITALPLGLLLLWLTRGLWRIWLRRQRATGDYSSSVVLVGSPRTVEHTYRELVRTPGAGYRVVGVCIPEGIGSAELNELGVPVFDNITVDAVPEVLNATGADTVIITSSDHLPPERIRRLSWNLEPGRHHLVMAPSLTDISGPRIHTRPVAGLPLVHIETPRYEGSKRASKRALDIVGSLGIILLLLPFIAAVALAIKLTSPGPLFYRQTRIGMNGQPFGMIKFRSMVVDANEMLADLLAKQGTSDKPLFKIKDDPRITRIGRFIRKYSIDEVPQLFNVLRGEMSLVGPRPQVSGEVELYDDVARRRLNVKPGMTGLWQVSGRSTLSWEDAIRLDLYYVENWSFTGDLALLARTVQAVVAPGDDAH
ncbi:sugar transferase [Rathayibacter sp. SD072]|uniref:sugar transferase n=1 Tax=Rathayibacter sp. SD072 TaxID=2781731 RepID=UPI0027DAACFC|nr:sugar transferase [Rathayibacter sp. SD072]